MDSCKKSIPNDENPSRTAIRNSSWASQQHEPIRKTGTEPLKNVTGAHGIAKKNIPAKSSQTKTPLKFHCAQEHERRYSVLRSVVQDERSEESNLPKP
jgi:hypothetical protein